MRMLLSLMILVLLVAAQAALAPRAELWSARPDWLLVATVFLALHAPPMQAVAGAWLLGFGADLLTLERTGLLALSYVLAALPIVAVREYVFRQHILTHVFAVLLIAVPLRCAWLVYRHALYNPGAAWAAEFAVDCLWGSVYAALWALLLHPVMLRVARPLGLRGPRYSHSGLHPISHGRI